MLTEIFQAHLGLAKVSTIKRITNNLYDKCDGKITPQEFINYFDFMEFVNIESRHSSRIKEYSARRTKVKELVKHPLYDLVMNIFVIFNCTSLFVKDMLEHYGTTKEFIYAWIYIEMFISWLFLFEMVFICYGFGFLHALKRRNHLKIEILFQIVSNVVFLMFLISRRTNMVIRTLEIIIILRSLRLLKLFNEVRQWKIIMRTIAALLKPFSTLLMVTFTLFLIFSIIGERFFGGLANYNSKEILGDQSVPDNYVNMNFNDLYSSFMTLFALMVVNNWFVIVNVFEVSTGSVWVRLYFLTFYFLSVIVVINIVVAFAIDMYSSVESLNQQKVEENKTKAFDYEDDTTTNLSVFKRDSNYQDEEKISPLKYIKRSNTTHMEVKNNIFRHQSEAKPLENTPAFMRKSNEEVKDIGNVNFHLITILSFMYFSMHPNFNFLDDDMSPSDEIPFVNHRHNDIALLEDESDHDNGKSAINNTLDANSQGSEEEIRDFYQQ